MVKDSEPTKELKEKYKDRFDPSQKDKEAGVQPLSEFEKQLIDQGIDPDKAAPTAGKTTRDGVMQFEETDGKKVEKVEETKIVSPQEVRLEAAAKAQEDKEKEEKKSK